MELISDCNGEANWCAANDDTFPDEHEKIPEFYRLGQYPYDPTPPAPDNLWIHYGYQSGKVTWWEWGFDTADWGVEGRLRNVYDRQGSSGKSYNEESWDETKVIYDQLGNQRVPDDDLPEFYTLGVGGMIDAWLEDMETFDYRNGAQSPETPNSRVRGRILWPKDGEGPSLWNHGHALMNPFDPWLGAPEPDPRPGRPWIDFDPTMPNPEPDVPGSGAGSSVGPGDDIMGGDGYHNPAYGIGDIPGGTFVGLDRFHAACSIPNDLQPSIPPGGLLGPDGVPPFDGFPGYRPPSDWTNPWDERPDIDPGFHLPMPFTPHPRPHRPSDPGVPEIMSARPPELVPGEGFVPGSSDGGFPGGGSGRDGSMPQPDMMGTTTTAPKIQCITTDTMSWDEYYSYQKGGSNWGGNQPGYNQTEHQSGVFAADSSTQSFEHTEPFSFSAGIIKAIEYHREADLYEAEAYKILEDFWRDVIITLATFGAEILVAKAVGALVASGLAARLVTSAGRVIRSEKGFVAIGKLLGRLAPSGLRSSLATGLRYTYHGWKRLERVGHDEQIVLRVLREGEAYFYAGKGGRKYVNYLLRRAYRGKDVVVGVDPATDAIVTIYPRASGINIPWPKVSGIPLGG